MNINLVKSIASFIGAAGLSILFGGILLLSFTNAAGKSVQLHIIFGLILLFIGVGFNSRSIWHYFKSQKGKHLIYAILIMSLHIYIIVCINYISFKNRKRIDYTQTKKFTLSDKTINLIKNKLDQDITLIMNENIHENSLRDLNELINQFKYHSKYIKVKRYHPLKDPNNAAILQRAYSLKPSHLLIVASETKGTSIDKGPLIDKGTKRITWFKTEQAIYNSLLNTINAKRYKIYFISGHGEPSTTSKSRNKPNVTQLVNWLLNENYSVEEINLNKLDKGIPKDCDVLAIINPTRRFQKNEIEIVDQYLRTKNKEGKKGCLFLALGSNYEQNHKGRWDWISTGLEELMIEYGIQFNANMIIEPTLTIKQMGMTSIYLPSNHFGKHPITEPFFHNKVSLALKGSTRSLSPPKQSRNTRRLMGLITSSTESKEIIDLNGFTNSVKKRRLNEYISKIESKNHFISIASTDPKPNSKKRKNLTADDFDPNSAKVIGIGNGLFLNSPISEAARDYFSNSIKWLTLENDLIGTGTDISKKVSFVIPENKEWIYKEIIFYLMPLFWIFFGGIVWWRRKN
ncbi:MAG: hypothetical protein COA79_03855 [Planctomycetota bacterium]|nr:MAG: hypothetical protein COA79_03855 [Planctomycetota bacterium]